MPPKNTHEKVTDYLKKYGLELLSPYVESHGELEIKHSICGHIFNRSLNHIQKNAKCPNCFPPKTVRKKFISVKQIIESKPGHKLLSNEYKNTYTPLKIQCKIANKVVVTTLKSYQLSIGCKACYQVRANNDLSAFKNKRLEEVAKSMEKEGYKLLSEKYKSNKQKLKYICSKGHKGTINFNNWLSGARCRICKYEDLSAEGNANWKGGLVDRKLVSYDVFAPQLGRSEVTRPDPEEPTILQAKCNYCGKWFRPPRSAVKGRLLALNASDAGEIRLYCSKKCKKECPVFWKRLYPEGFKKATSREVQPELRQMVFERDEWNCQKCGANSSLHCHHIESVAQNPIESADIDNCLTLCKKCHKWAHTEEGCKYFELRCLK